MALPRDGWEPTRVGGPAETEPEEDLSPTGDADRFVAACCYFFASLFPVAVVVFLLNLRTPGFRRYHAQQAIAFALIILAFELVVAGLGYGVVAAVAPLPFEFWYAYKTYASGEAFTIPYVTPLARRLFPSFPG